MKIFITGASGFLGQAVVKAALTRGHSVVALVRPGATVPLGNDIITVCGDLRRPAGFEETLRQVDAVIHLAAGTSGTLDEQLPASVVGTERLLDVMQKAGVKRLVLASTFSVYDWSRLFGRLTERSPLERDLYLRDGYAIAKTWQERIVRERTAQDRLQLTVLRPGFIWGPGREWVPGAGLIVGRRILVNGPFRRLPVTHVTNCANCFVAACENHATIGRTFNVVDTDDIRAWRFAWDYARAMNLRFPIVIPYTAGLLLAHISRLIARCLFGRGYKLPGVLLPIRYRARFRSMRFPNKSLADTIGWRPPLNYRDALHATHVGPKQLAELAAR